VKPGLAGLELTYCMLMMNFTDQKSRRRSRFLQVHSSFHVFLHTQTDIHICLSPAFRHMDLSEHISEDLSMHPEFARDAKTYIYSRLSQGVRSRVERVLSEINVRILWSSLTRSHAPRCRVATLSPMGQVWPLHTL
jgi:hypothetical protein